MGLQPGYGCQGPPDGGIAQIEEGEKDMEMVKRMIGELALHPIFNVGYCKRGNRHQVRIGRLRIEWRVVSMEWQDLCDEADARDREISRRSIR